MTNDRTLSYARSADPHEAGRRCAILSIWLGASSIILNVVACTGPLLGLPAILLGLNAMRRVTNATNPFPRRWAFVGIALGAISVVMSIVGWSILLFAPPIDP